MDGRFGGSNWGPGVPRRRTSAKNWNGPRRWNRKAAATGKRLRVFCSSLADVFDNAIDPAWRADLWHLVRETPHLDWLLLTKRPQNIANMLPADWYAGWPNVWLGTSAEDQARLAERAWHLALVPAEVRFLSCEPMLGALNTRHAENRWGTVWDALTGKILHAASGPQIVGAIDWVIVGGESGPDARPMHPHWARSLRDQCAAAGVPLFFKQWGEWCPESVANSVMGAETAERISLLGERRTARFGARRPDEVTIQRVGKKAAGDLLDGVRHHAWPSHAVMEPA